MATDRETIDRLLGITRVPEPEPKKFYKKQARVIVSASRHKKLFKEALRRERAGEKRCTMEEVAEELFRKAEKI